MPAPTPGRGPAHAVEFLDNTIPLSVLFRFDSSTPPEKIPVGNTTLDPYVLLAPDQQRQVVQAAALRLLHDL